jgi:hypothetical protein
MADEVVVVMMMMMDGLWPFQYFSLSGHFLSVSPFAQLLSSLSGLFLRVVRFFQPAQSLMQNTPSGGMRIYITYGKLS